MHFYFVKDWIKTNSIYISQTQFLKQDKEQKNISK